MVYSMAKGVGRWFGMNSSLGNNNTTQTDQVKKRKNANRRRGILEKDKTSSKIFGGLCSLSQKLRKTEDREG